MLSSGNYTQLLLLWWNSERKIPSQWITCTWDRQKNQKQKTVPTSLPRLCHQETTSSSKGRVRHQTGSHWHNMGGRKITELSDRSMDPIGGQAAFSLVIITNKDGKGKLKKIGVFISIQIYIMSYKNNLRGIMIYCSVYRERKEKGHLPWAIVRQWKFTKSSLPNLKTRRNW